MLNCVSFWDIEYSQHIQPFGLLLKNYVGGNYGKGSWRDIKFCIVLFCDKASLCRFCAVWIKIQWRKRVKTS